eukprot:534251-Amphidinium_carterae.2
MRVCAVLVAVIATYWTVPWQPKCFVRPRHFVSKRGRVCKHADTVQGTKLPELSTGVESFEDLRLDEPPCAYVDKTGFLPKLVGVRRQHLLTRPRRFGKTLLLDTIRCIFMDNGPKMERSRQNTLRLERRIFKARFHFPHTQLSLTSFGEAFSFLARQDNMFDLLLDTIRGIFMQRDSKKD